MTPDVCTDPTCLDTPLQNKPNDTEPVTHPLVRILSVDA
jgi:hypothetical protein